MGSYWFAAAPSRQERTRISLNFGLGRAERLFNERVVPELGRVWFVRQISWPVAAIALRERLRGTINTKASAISHGLEALGCKLECGKTPNGERILGKRAFGRDVDDGIWAFDKLRTTKHYVQNTHRQAASRTIRDEGGLGLASGSRFDTYELTTNGQELADVFLDQPVGRGGGRARRCWLGVGLLRSYGGVISRCDVHYPNHGYFQFPAVSTSGWRNTVGEDPWVHR